VIGHIYIYGEVGKQVTLDTVLKEITPKATEYEVHIHSPGGEVFEGYAIYNAIKNTGKKITVKIEGVCASIATLIAATGSKVIMNTKAQFMIHNPRVQVGGEAKDLRNAAAQLDRIKSQLIDSWTGRTNLSAEQLSEMYDHETWLTPEQAMEMGFVDEVQDVLRAVASVDFKHYNMKNTILEKVESLYKMIANFSNPKNMTDTLSDGRVVVTPDDGDWTGKPITLEDGSPLEDGTFTLAGGVTITVAGGTITERKEPEAKKEEPKTEEKPEDMELKEKLATAEARIKELESAIEAKNASEAAAQAKAKSFENKLNVDLKKVQDELAKIKNTTAGDTTPPKLATTVTNSAGPVPVDGFQVWLKQLTDKRNTD
jgi:ATP-dependent protease ClpP protease subunit